MKGIVRLLPLLIMFFVLQSCENEPYILDRTTDDIPPDYVEGDVSTGNDQDEEQTDLIINTWSLEYLNLKNATASSNIGGQPVTAYVAGQGNEFFYLLKLKESGDFTSEGNFNLTLQTTFIGQSYEEVIPIVAADFLSSGSYSFDEESLFLAVDNATLNAKITLLDSENLHLEIPIDRIETIDGMEVRVVGKAELHFIRV